MGRLPAILAMAVFALTTVAVDVAILRQYTSLFDGPAVAAAAVAGGPQHVAMVASRGAQSVAGAAAADDDPAAWGAPGSMRRLAARDAGPVVTKRPNYTLPACAVARRDGAFRPDVAFGGGGGGGGTTLVSAKRPPVRILVMGMQSSGASTFLFLLAQIPGSVAVVDLWVGRPAPSPEQLGLSDEVTAVLLKATINTAVDVGAYMRAFRPDVSILLLRHPAHNLKSLASKFYRDTAGSPGQKFLALEAAFASRDRLGFGLTIAYEDIFRYREKVVRRLQAKLGLSRAASDCLFDFKRKVEHIQAFTNHHCAWCGDTYTTQWGYGNLRGADATSADSSSSSSEPAREVCAARTSSSRGSCDVRARAGQSRFVEQQATARIL